MQLLDTVVDEIAEGVMKGKRKTTEAKTAAKKEADTAASKTEAESSNAEEEEDDSKVRCRDLWGKDIVSYKGVDALEKFKGERKDYKMWNRRLRNALKTIWSKEVGEFFSKFRGIPEKSVTANEKL